jgi:hypothetical protein
MDRSACHVALALGCFLYTYPPGAIAQLAPVLCHQHQLHSRFPRAHLFGGADHTRRTRPPTVHDRQLVQQALTMFTPWGSAHVPPPALGHSMLATHFDGVPARSDWDRIHALIDPIGAGLRRLIREYNRQFPAGSARRLTEPDAMLAIPRFAR